jgi:hypothetical protein
MSPQTFASRIRTALANGAGEVRAAKSAVDAALIERLRAQRDALRAELDEARRERDEALTKLGFWRDWTKKIFGESAPCGDHDSRALIDAKLAAAKAGPVVTVDDAKAVAFAIGKVWESPYRETLIGVRDHLSQLVQARGEMEAGK